MANQNEDRTLHTQRSFKTTIETMWQAWTDPKQIINWWGPIGFTSTIHQMELKEGGEWNLTLHGPDGTNFPNRSVFKEIVPLKKIIFEHFNPHFITTVIFNTDGEQIQIDWEMLFDSVEMYDIIVKAHKADEGQQQNLDKLENYLSTNLH